MAIFLFFADNILKCIFFYEKFWILNINSLNSVITRSPIDTHKSALVQGMAWLLMGDKPLPESLVIKMPDAIWCP